jgi:1-acyl-sn-glycerol-3-phosphate acyltransferase
MTKVWDRRSTIFISVLEKTFWPFIRCLFRIETHGVEQLTQENCSLLFISNHNSGALIESFSALMLLKTYHNRAVFGFTHPSIFKVPLIKNYFEALGAVPATYDVAAEIFNHDQSLMIFPGGNEQALRPVWKYKENSFRQSHGWAKIAKTNSVKVVPVTFKNTHFINPILLSGNVISKILILPMLLKLRIASISIGQIVSGILIYYFCSHLGMSTLLSGIIAYLGFILTPIIPILPVKVSVTFHQSIEVKAETNQEELENKVKSIMDSIYT